MRKNGALLVCLGVYLLALLAAVLSGRFLRGAHPLFVVFIADLDVDNDYELFSVPIASTGTTRISDTLTTSGTRGDVKDGGR